MHMHVYIYASIWMKIQSIRTESIVLLTEPHTGTQSSRRLTASPGRIGP